MELLEGIVDVCDSTSCLERVCVDHTCKTAVGNVDQSCTVQGLIMVAC